MAHTMKGGLSFSILSYLNAIKFSPASSTYKLNWLLVLASVPVLIAASTVVTNAAPQKIAQANPNVNLNRPTLGIGSQGERVSELQAALKLLGFYTGPVDGNYTANTASAVSRFKQAAGLNPDGIVDTATWQKLFPGQAVATAPSPAPKPTPAKPTAVAPAQAGNIRRATTPQPEPKPAQPRQTTKPKPQPRSTTRPATTRPANTRPTQPRTPQIPRFERTPGIQYTPEGLPILRLGNRGSEVGRLQEILKRLGFLSGDVDGDFGPTTEAAVKAAQSRYGLEADGVAGGGTWYVLLERSQRQR
uniref:peptidoglycan-binding domain-containing protein n=2 Tax=unclassified Calothrix TaxID=2619626 RepID=UPI0028C3A9B6|nr:peptidoglycan-binding protein [Calothrix sp. FACHB-168]